MMARKILLALFLLYAITMHAAYVSDLPTTLRQPDGTRIDILLTGDEYYIRPHDKANNTIIQDTQTGYWCWGIQQGEDVASSGKPIHLFPSEAGRTGPSPTISDNIYQKLRQPFDNLPARTPTTGSIENIVVFIRFADDPEFTASSAEYDAIFNASGQNVNSLYQYYYDASYHQLQVHSPFFPTPTQTAILSYQSPHPRSYFMPYNAVTNPGGYTGGASGTQRTAREHQLLADAVAYINPTFPTNINIDSDNDGRVDNVCFVIRGATEGWSELLWPHRSILYTQTVNMAGKRVWDYNFHIESHIQYAGVGVIAHEFGHSLGAPDYYHNSQNGTPIGQWDLMSNNTPQPQSMSAYTKWHYMHWVDDLPIITQAGTYTLHPNTLFQGVLGYRIPSPFSLSEYFVVEYRNNATGIIDSSLPGSGLLIYRVNTYVNGNANGPPDELYVYRPDGTLNADGQITAAYFSADVGRVTFNSDTNPHPFLSNGSAGGISIQDISLSAATITFYVNPPDTVPIIEIPYTQDFNETASLASIGWGSNLTQVTWILPIAGIGNTNALAMNVHNGQPYKYAYTPLLAGTNTHTRLAFSYRIINYTANWAGILTPTTLGANDKVFIEVSTTGDTGEYNTIREINSTNHIASTSFKLVALPLADFEAENITVRFRAVRGSGDWVLVIDDVEISDNILYPPESITASTSDNNVSLLWTPPTDPVNLIGYTLHRNGSPLFPTQSLEYTDEYIAYGSYTYSVRAVYSDGVSQAQSVQVAITSTDYFENFDSGTSLSAIDWGGDIGSTSGIFAISGVNGTNAVAININSGQPTQSVYSPMIYYISSQSSLSFNYRIVDYTTDWGGYLTPTTLTPDDKVFIEASITGNQGEYTLISEINDQNHAASTSFATLQLPLTAFNNENINIRFREVGLAGNWCFVLDNVAVRGRLLLQPPQALTATAGNDFVDLAWQAPESGSPLDYRVYRNGMALTYTTATTFHDSTAQNGNTYTYHVAARYAAGEEVTSATVTVALDSMLPPRGLSAHLIVLGDYATVVLFWSRPSNAPETRILLGYNVYRNGNLQTENPVTDLVYSDAHLATGSYTYAVSAVYTNGESAQCEPATVTIYDLYPPTDLRVVSIGDRQVDLAWTPPLDLTNFLHYKVYRIYFGEDGVGVTVTIQTLYPFIRDINLTNGIEYWYHVTAIYSIGESDPTYWVPAMPVSDSDEVITPITTELYGNYPNPFNPETVIRFGLAREDRVSIDVFSVKGQLVKTLVSGVYGAGEHKVVWNGRDDLGRQVGSGVYFYRMCAGEYVGVKKMLLVK